MRPIGFSTGALGVPNSEDTLVCLIQGSYPCIEFSALRWDELKPVARRAQTDFARFQYISFHAPSTFSAEQEPELVAFLETELPARCIVVIHPDAIVQPALWRRLGTRLAIENMDRRKPRGRTADELAAFFSLLPDAHFCFDAGHAQQWDPWLVEAYRMLRDFASRLVQVHVSDVATNSRHEQLSPSAILAFREIASMIPEAIPMIVESQILPDQMDREIERVREAFPLPNPLRAAQ